MQTKTTFLRCKIFLEGKPCLQLLP